MSRLRCRVLLAGGVSSGFMTSLAIVDATAATTTTEPNSGQLRFCGPTRVRGVDTRRVSRQWTEWAEGQPEGFRCVDEQYGATALLSPGGAFGG
jgi:hypothetical protein